MVNDPNAELGFYEATFYLGGSIPAKICGSVLRNSPWQRHPVAVLLAMLPEAIEATAVLSQQAPRY